MKQRDQPHDRYFRDLMEDINIARSFLRAYMNPKVQAQIDWNTLDFHGYSKLVNIFSVIFFNCSKLSKQQTILLGHQLLTNRFYLNFHLTLLVISRIAD